MKQTSGPTLLETSWMLAEQDYQIGPCFELIATF
jgi:hypothetical protein